MSAETIPGFYHYDEDYSFLQERLRRAGSPVHEIYNATRAYAEVFLPLKLRPEQKLLDVGCCLGQLGSSFRLGGVTTVGIDLNRAALIQGLRIYGSKKNSFIEANAVTLPFKDGVFDAITSQDLLEHAPNELMALRMFLEMERVLKGRRMVHKITVTEDVEWIDADSSHALKWSATRWKNWFEDKGWKVIAPTDRKLLPVPTRRGIVQGTMHGYFLIEKQDLYK